MKKNSNNSIINLNVNKDDSSINDFIWCWDYFQSRPNKVTIHNNYSSKFFNDLISKYSNEKNIFTEILPSEDNFTINDKVLAKISDEVFLSYIVIDRNKETSIVSDLVFFYKTEESLELVQEIISKFDNCVIDFCEEEINNLNTLSISQNSLLDIEPISNDKIDLDCIESYYHNSTFKDVNKLIKKIKKSNKGLSILYGERGTGKTSIIHHIAEKLDRIVIFIPNTFVDQTINNPDFRKFLKKYQKPVIVLDDCEMIFSEFFAKSNMIVNNLLQLVDGFLSDSIEVNIITLFNVDDESEIDHSLLECNNLIDIVSFDYLTDKEADDLATHLGDKTKFKNKSKLIDIVKKKQTSQIKKIGF